MRLAIGCLALLAAGCGGGTEEADAGRPAADRLLMPRTEPVSVTHLYASPVRARLPERIERGAEPPAPKWPVATTEDPVLTVEDPYGRKVGSFDLSPVLGRGYAELKVTLNARRIGAALPPEPVRPVCPEDARCVYGLAKPHSIALTDDRTLKLVPRGDGVALVARTLKLEAPQTVELVFSRGDEEISRKRITLLADYWAGRPM